MTTLWGMGHFWVQRVGSMAAGVCVHIWVDQEAEKEPQLELRLTLTHKIHVQKSTFSSKVLYTKKFYNLSKYFSLVGNTKFGVHTRTLSSFESETDFIVKILNLA